MKAKSTIYNIMQTKNMIENALRLDDKATTYTISQQLTEVAQHTERVVVEGSTVAFDIEGFAKNNPECKLTYGNVVHNQVVTSWQRESVPNIQTILGLWHPSLTNNTTDKEKPEISQRLTHGWILVEWKGESFEIILLRCSTPALNMPVFWILASTTAVAEDLIKTVCQYTTDIRDELLVFDNGHFRKDADLLAEIKLASFDNLVLRGPLKENIRTDLETFFKSQELYATYGVPWKRGILLVGPPGNGKTHTIKAIINNMQAQYPNRVCIYVKSFASHRNTEQGSIGMVFARARSNAPCLLVLEDLDSLVTNSNRSFFLNELDGFSSNEGMVTVASTNHPEKLDVAILERPSRFDRKYQFELPDKPERLEYIRLWRKSLKGGAEISDAEMTEIAGDPTEGFSFAYMKEMFMSSLMRWMSKKTDGEDKGLGRVMLEQVVVLAEQIDAEVKSREKMDRKAGATKDTMRMFC